MDSKTVRIIPCDFGNIHHCNALVHLMNEYISDKMGGGLPYTAEQKTALIKGLKEHPSALVYFAVAGEQYIGLTNCFVNFATFTVKPFINIHDVIVTQSWRNKGVGRKLLDEIIKKARETGCSKVTLEVRSDNMNAQYLYHSMGFLDAEPRQYYWSKYL